MKNYFIYILLVLLVLLGSSCDKEEGGDLSGSEELIGRVFMSDPLANLPTDIPQAGKKITIRYADSPEPANYLFSTTTDTKGYFQFSNLKENRPYTIKYQDTLRGMIYEDSVTVQAPDNKVVLIGKLATTKQTGLFVEIKDFSGNLLKGAHVCIFTSNSNIGYLKGLCDGSIFKLTTNSAGKASLASLPAGSYYLLASATIDNVLLTSRTKIDITNSIADVKMQVQKPRGISLVVTDESGGLVKDAEVCLFTSSASPSYENGTCDGSISKATTDGSGTANFYGIPAGTYYALANTTLQQMPYQGKQIITVNDNLEVSKIILKKPNGIHFITTDENSETIGNITVCVFTSNILFQRNSCEGNNVQVTTKSNGKASLYNLEKGTYYLFASRIIQKDTLIAKTVVTVGDQIVEGRLKLVKK